MTGINTDTYLLWYTGPERRIAYRPRRSLATRRYRKRIESLVCDCRSGEVRRMEDEGGYLEYCEFMYNQAENRLNPR